MTPFAQPHLGLVVEGRGAVPAVPLLLRRWLHLRDDYREVLGKPAPCHGRDKALKYGGLEGFVATAAVRPGCAGVLVLLDGEGDCVAKLGPNLLERDRESSQGKPVTVALADPMFEAWLVASAESLGLEGLEYRPERNPVALIEESLRPSKYSKPVWQPRLVHRVDIPLAHSRSISLTRYLARFDELLLTCRLLP